jgi:hypothetical protein
VASRIRQMQHYNFQQDGSCSFPDSLGLVWRSIKTSLVKGTKMESASELRVVRNRIKQSKKKEQQS